MPRASVGRTGARPGRPDSDPDQGGPVRRLIGCSLLGSAYNQLFGR
jgi:hypothetical protein